ncbi:Tyrosine-protein kinase etk [Pseudobythopirellula maris]|uniref:Tyrosine-protein kinase etk n=1 Tax=Pseudobythopirellula maris TaxID=2527991 RepID=A0A5C5ZR72_9BACT|nr:polysaccharide biosynthesis tyrosine autokinase [Pseudobythopirellula maris]TWT89726.1 Tyrosine-protein kinase etk [Pseudobythopirellula maris]
MNEDQKSKQSQLTHRTAGSEGARGGSAHARHALKPSRAEAAQPQIGPMFFWWVFTMSWRTVVPIGLLLAIPVAAVIYLTYTPMYEATGLIRIEDSPQYVAFRSGSVDAGGRKFIQTQIELMRNPVVLRETLADEDVGSAEHLKEESNRVKAIQKRLKVKQVGGSELYEVAYTSPSAKESADVVRAVLQQYFARQSDEEYQRAQRVIDLLERERARRQFEVERLRKHVIDLAKDLTGMDPFGHRTMTNADRAFSPLSGYHRQLAEIEVKKEVLRAELESIQEAEVVNTDFRERSGAIDLEVDMNGEVQQRERQISQLRSGLRELRKTVKHPQSNRDYMALSERVRQEEQSLSEFKDKLRQSLLLSARMSRQKSGKTLADTKREELEMLSALEASVREKYEAELAKVQEGGGKNVELEFAKSELAREAKVFEMIASRKLALQTESKAPARVEVMDEVMSSNVPEEAIPWKQLFVACAMSMVVPYGVVVLREMALRRVTDSDQIYQDTNLRILGEISSFPKRKVAANPQMLPRRLRREMYVFAESINALRTSLVFAAEPDQPLVIALTSAVSGEGKTSISVALAMSFANASGKPTLLIDGDTRKPGVPDLIDLRHGQGLTEVLAGQCTLDEALQPARGVANLQVLPAGKSRSDHQLLLQPQRLSQLIESARDRFDTILIDTPPVLGASEALSLCRSADMTTLCALRGVSRSRQVKMAAEKLDSAGANLAGAALSGVAPMGYGSVYAYGYGFPEQEERPEGLVGVPGGV